MNVVIVPVVKYPASKVNSPVSTTELYSSIVDITIAPVASNVPGLIIESIVKLIISFASIMSSVNCRTSSVLVSARIWQ